ncbi:uncharacterized protein TM35_001151010 [Trypanosoma theileri]|uniref:Mucin TcMUCII n=1 Tax=Trypanosoma theileri TaxID=67003 RepID=A0A1X0NE19_9TRYP|nr:uncharacterized protein TM35_001151010 [Trypanosoma theileri]ORC81494.1 hypothetical protein TM35_001151010 [Trypanosoma theileri]
MIMMRTVLCVMLLALYCTCSFVLANTDDVRVPNADVQADVHVEEEPESGGEDGAAGSKQLGKEGPGKGKAGRAETTAQPGSSGGDMDGENKMKQGPVGPQGPSESQLPGNSTQSPRQPASPSQPVTGNTNDGALSPSDNQNDQIQGGGKADLQAKGQVTERQESGNNGGSNSGSEKNTVGSPTEEDPNANSEEKKSENAQSLNIVSRQVTNDAVASGTQPQAGVGTEPSTPSASSHTDGAAGSENSAQTSTNNSASTNSEPSTTASNEDSTSTTTTTTTTTLPPELTNNKKGDADSSSSISSSVWFRVPLLIVVTLSCILVC